MFVQWVVTIIYDTKRLYRFWSKNITQLVQRYRDNSFFNLFVYLVIRFIKTIEFLLASNSITFPLLAITSILDEIFYTKINYV